MEVNMTNQNNTQHLAVPPSGQGAGVLVLHAWWGMTDVIRELCDRLAQEGFVALAPDMFAGQTARTIDEAEQLVTHLVDPRTVAPVILGALQALRAHPAVKGDGLGVVGFSYGAYWSLWLAQKKPDLVRAVTLFYGTDGGGGDFKASRAAFLGHFAENDPYEPEESISGLEKALDSADRPKTFYTYPGTGHWFFEPDRQEAYQAPAAQLAWERTAAFLHQQLDESPA
jgi:carboxymethylenebutenolidase